MKNHKDALGFMGLVPWESRGIAWFGLIHLDLQESWGFVRFAWIHENSQELVKNCRHSWKFVKTHDNLWEFTGICSDWICRDLWGLVMLHGDSWEFTRICGIRWCLHGFAGFSWIHRFRMDLQNGKQHYSVNNRLINIVTVAVKHKFLNLGSCTEITKKC